MLNHQPNQSLTSKEAQCVQCQLKLWGCANKQCCDWFIQTLPAELDAQHTVGIVNLRATIGPTTTSRTKVSEVYCEAAEAEVLSSRRHSHGVGLLRCCRGVAPTMLSEAT